MKNDEKLYAYSSWDLSVRVGAQEGFVGVRMGAPATLPDLQQCCEDTIGCLGYVEVRHTHY